MHLSKAVVLPYAVVSTFACVQSPPTNETSASRDSAGIRIVQNETPAWEAGREWRLAGSPSLDLGRLGGPAETQFFRIRSGTRLSDGSLVVASSGSHDLRRFAADGTHVWTVGQEGEGPGEFRGLREVVATPGDTLLTYDLRLNRLTRFSSDGELVDSTPVEGSREDALARVEVLLPDSRAVCTLQFFREDDAPPPTGEVGRDTVGIFVSGRADAPATDLGRFPGPEMAVLSAGETDGQSYVAIARPPFGRSTEIAADGAGVWVGDTDRYEIRRYRADGTLEGLIRRSFEPVAVDDALIRQAMQEDLDRQSDDVGRRMIRQRWEGLPIPRTLPAFDDLTVDRAGNLWVRAFEIPGAPELVWSVFTPDGSWLGDVTFPASFDPLEIGDDYVLGRFTDELDVEHVQVWELVKPAD